jgi:hypothetical protein
VSLRAGLKGVEKKISSGRAGIEPRFPDNLANSLVTILTELSRLLSWTKGNSVQHNLPQELEFKEVYNLSAFSALKAKSVHKKYCFRDVDMRDPRRLSNSPYLRDNSVCRRPVGLY